MYSIESTYCLIYTEMSNELNNIMLKYKKQKTTSYIIIILAEKKGGKISFIYRLKNQIE